eukprot:GDKI01037483.1.p1 GENE.GDKI01037483.1~~GDKI01037483.1.p1  ORF type:complete len:685 (-),score=249.03 GDKI01037483.1:774-2828(-)
MPFTKPAHPLDSMGPEEVEATTAAVKEYCAQLGITEVWFNAMQIKEPHKDLQRKFEQTGEMPPRVSFTVIQSFGLGKGFEFDVNLDERPGKVVRFLELTAEQQPLLSLAETLMIESLVSQHEETLRLVKERYGVTDMKQVVCDPWMPNTLGDPMFMGKRYMFCLMFLRPDGDSATNHYAHPIDVVPIVDVYARKIIKVETQKNLPKTNMAPLNFHRSKQLTVNRLLKPLDIVQRDGPSFTVQGNLVHWYKWSFRVSFNFREGLVLHDLHYDNRSVCRRASLVEMAVPYADPNIPFVRKCAFDVGDYGMGYCTVPLELSCDCLGQIHYFDAVLSDAEGKPYTIPKAVCMHEEDAGVQWKHVEYRDMHAEARRARRLVISHFCTAANYDYGFYWNLYTDGTFKLEAKLTGILSVNVLAENDNAQKPYWGTLVAPHVNAQFHQHMFNVRLDMAVDGEHNSVSELDAVLDPRGPENPHGNGWQLKERVFERESDGQSVVKPEAMRVWKIFNPNKKNWCGSNVAYKLVPNNQPLLMAYPEAWASKRGKFASRSIMVTPYTEGENFPAGDYTLMSAEDTGLAVWTQKDRPIKNTDIVVWHTFGVLHVPRIEDFPVMPVEITGFELKPFGFFDMNPTLDLPLGKDTTCGLSRCEVTTLAAGFEEKVRVEEGGCCGRTGGVGGAARTWPSKM